MNAQGAFGVPGEAHENPPALSVVVLTYNSGLTIEDCLESLVSQDFTDFETIVVDDDSTDETIAITSRYASRLRLKIVRNGSHNIPKGRNIGLASSSAHLVAFVDSDDFVAQDWTKVIAKAFDEQPDLALISGDLIPAYRSMVSEAIGVSDDTVRRLTARGAMMFCAGNSAVNLLLLPGSLFDEEFEAAEDLECYSRIRDSHRCSYVPEMRIYHTSRDSFRAYAKQMHRYGFMKLYFGVRKGSYRVIDFVPLSLIALSVVASLVFGPWWIALSIVPFSLLEAFVVVAYTRCRPAIGALIFPVWLTKNIAWSAGICHALVSLALHPDVRHRLRSKRSRYA